MRWKNRVVDKNRRRIAADTNGMSDWILHVRKMMKSGRQVFFYPCTPPVASGPVSLRNIISIRNDKIIVRFRRNTYLKRTKEKSLTSLISERNVIILFLDFIFREKKALSLKKNNYTSSERHLHPNLVSSIEFSWKNNDSYVYGNFYRIYYTSNLPISYMQNVKVEKCV